MKLETIKEIIEIMPKGKTGFHYFKDRYALMLLSDLIEDEIKLSELKMTPWAKLLNRPLVKSLSSQCGDGVLYKHDLDGIWPDLTKQFLLTLSQWGGERASWQQTCRHGYNLVLQLNFSNQHHALFNKLLRPMKHHSLRSCGHPVMQPDERELFRETLAWARIDLDFDRNEALIEEIQNDWLRNALWWLSYVKRCQKNQRPLPANYCLQTDLEKVQSYCDKVLMPYRKMWDEAMLAASIDFIYKQLGINVIYYHSYESGAWLKSISSTLPPRSLYTDLPKRFCFTCTEQEPTFLSEDRYFRNRKRKGKHLNYYWYRMNLGANHVTA